MTALAKKVFQLFSTPESLPNPSLNFVHKRCSPEDARPFFVDARDDLPCPTCGASVQLEPPVPDELPTRIWACPSCHAWGATRDGCQFPAVWLSSRTLQ